MSVIVWPCQQPCCRRARGERPKPETPEETGKRIADDIIAALRAALEEKP